MKSRLLPIMPLVFVAIVAFSIVPAMASSAADDWIIGRPYLVGFAPNPGTGWHGGCTVTWTYPPTFTPPYTATFIGTAISPFTLITGPVVYRVDLTALIGVPTADDFWGLFNVRRNGVLIWVGVTGHVYGLSQPVGAYFKLWLYDAQGFEFWLYSAWIIRRG